MSTGTQSQGPGLAMASSAAAQLYDSIPIPRGSQCIRVLDIAAKNLAVGEALTGTLRIVDLKDSPRFAALSYVWGKSSDKFITCNGCKVNVTDSCFNALSSLRQTLGTLTIWVDAICINQMDDDEKAAQMALMGEIYTWAEAAYIWLGPGTGATKKALGYLKSVGVFRIFPAGMPWRDGTGPKLVFQERMRFFKRIFLALHNATMWLIEQELSPISRCFAVPRLVCDRASFLELVDQAWLKRSWTFQEIALASNPILVFGQDHVSWLEWHQALCWVRDLWPLYRGIFSHMLPDRKQRDIVDDKTASYEAFEKWMSLFNVWETLPRPCCWNGDRFRKVRDKTGGFRDECSVREYLRIVHTGPIQLFAVLSATLLSVLTVLAFMGLCTGLTIWIWKSLATWIVLDVEYILFAVPVGSFPVWCGSFVRSLAGLSVFPVNQFSAITALSILFNDELMHLLTSGGATKPSSTTWTAHAYIPHIRGRSHVLFLVLPLLITLNLSNYHFRHASSVYHCIGYPLDFEQRIHLVGLVRAMRERECSEPKDRVFAVTAISLRLGIPQPTPDYRKSIGEIYRDAFTGLVEWDPSFISLLIDTGSRLPGAPSWVPDWSTVARRSWFSSSYMYGSMQIPRWPGEELPISISGSTLSVQAALLRTATHCTVPFRIIQLDSSGNAMPAMKENLLHNTQVLCQWVMRARRDMPVDSSHHSIPLSLLRMLLHGPVDSDTQNIFNKVYTIMIRHSAQLEKELETRTGILPATRATLEDMEVEKPCLDFIIDIYNRLAGRRGLFLCHDGPLGSGPAAMLRGDSIFHVPGVPVPMTLRAQRDDAGRDVYTVLGPAYIGASVDLDPKTWRDMNMDWIQVDLV